MVLCFVSVDEIIFVIIQMKATEQYFSCGTVYYLNKVNQNFASVKVIVQYFPVVLFIMLYKVILAFESMVEISKCDHSNKSF